MIYLTTPAQYEGVTVYPDYSDPRQFYYLPDRPHLAVDEHNRPAVRFLVYKANLDDVSAGQETVTGFFIFDTSLAWPEATLTKVAQKIQDDYNLDQPPRLAPLLYKSGTVRLVFLDRTTALPGDKPDGSDGSGSGTSSSNSTTNTPPTPNQQWVIALESSGTPSLYGENRAIFSATLTKQATQLIYSAFDGFIPAGVIYDLDFVGMQPAFNVHVSADWKTVYTALREGFRANVIFFSSDVEKVVNNLVDQKVITVKAALEGVGDEGMESQFNEVRKQLVQYVLDNFFKPVPYPDKPDQGGIGHDIGEGLREFHDLTSPLHVGYSRTDLTDDQVASMSIDYDVERAVERRIVPQAHISVFFQDYNLTRDQVITVVNGADDFWKEVEFSVSANADFNTDGLASVGVDVAYGGAIPPGANDTLWSFLLDKSHLAAQRSAWYDPKVGHTYQYRYDAIFAPNAVPGPELSASSGWRPQDGSVLVISPEELYLNRRVEFQFVKNFPVDQYPQVQVHLSYSDPASGWSHEDSGLIDSSKPSWVANFRSHRAATQEVRYRFSYQHSAGPVETDWQATSGELVLVQDPRHPFRVRILVAGDRSKIEDLLLDFRYEDPAHEIVETGSVRYNQKNINDPQEWDIPLADQSKHVYSYNQTLVDTDGNVITTGWVQDDRNTLPVGVIYAKRWDVQPQVVGATFDQNGLDTIKLSLHYHDDANNYSADKDMLFSQPGKGESWPLQLKDPSVRQYTYNLTYVLQTGFERSLGPLTSSDTFLIISSVPPNG